MGVFAFGCYSTYILSTLFSPATAILVLHLIIGFRWASFYKYLFNFLLHIFEFGVATQLQHLLICITVHLRFLQPIILLLQFF